VALITNKVDEHDQARERFRQFALATGNWLHPERVKFVYLYAEVQKKVMEVLTKGNSTRKDTVLEVRKKKEFTSFFLPRETYIFI
jgi:hypothetical protein